MIYKHLVEHRVLPEVSEAGVADQLPVSVGEGAEHPKAEEMASMDPVVLPFLSDTHLAIKLKELELELGRQQYQSQLLHARTVELETKQTIKLKTKSSVHPSAADTPGVSVPVLSPINASTPSPIPAPWRNS